MSVDLAHSLFNLEYARAWKQRVLGERLRSFCDILFRLGIRPNHISLIGFLCCAVSAYSFPSRYVMFVLFLGLYYLFDGFDGLYARATGTATPFGQHLDKLLDLIGGALFYLQAARLQEPLAIPALVLYLGNIAFIYGKHVDKEVGESCDFRVFAVFGLGKIGLVWDVVKFLVFDPVRTFLFARQHPR